MDLTAIAVDVNGTDEQAYSENIATTPITLVAMADGVSSSLMIKGTFKANVVTGGTVAFQWAQGTSDANNTTLALGSWISLRRIN